jgi:hypothetical protein
MLSPHEKAYCQALLALRQREYAKAETYFGQAAEHFEDNREFMILWETTRVLLAVKRELAGLPQEERDKIDIEEAFSRG